MASLHSLARRLWHRQPIPLTQIQSEFIRTTLELFDFLVTDYGYRFEITGAGSPEIVVLFRNNKAGVEIMLADQSWIIPTIVPLKNGKLPAWFDWKLNDLYTGFPPEWFFEIVDPSWTRPAHRKIENAQDIKNELRGYAEELRGRGGPLLEGDRAVYERMEDLARRRL